MELDALAERERPGEAVTRRLPVLRERGHDGERLIELDEAVEELLRDGAAINVADARGIERDGIGDQRTAIVTSALLGWLCQGRCWCAEDQKDEEKAGEAATASPALHQ